MRPLKHAANHMRCPLAAELLPAIGLAICRRAQPARTTRSIWCAQQATNDALVIVRFIDSSTMLPDPAQIFNQSAMMAAEKFCP